MLLPEGHLSSQSRPFPYLSDADRRICLGDFKVLGHIMLQLGEAYLLPTQDMAFHNEVSENETQ